MLSGGRLLGQGLYGCVFTSPLSCIREKGKAKDALPALSKLTEEEEAALEMSVADRVRRIPLWRNYFAVAESMCSPSKKQTEKDLDECNVLQEKPLSSFRVLRMAYAGTPLTEYVVDFKTFQPMRFITHLLEAGSLLTLFGMVHRDLHYGNVVVDHHQVPRIIDFNLAIPIQTKTHDLENMVMHQYDYRIAHEPPDSTLLMAVAHGKRISHVIHLMVTKKSVLRKLRTITHQSESEMERQLEDVAQEATVRDGDARAWFRAHWRTIDSWGIGIMIVDLLSKWIMWPSFAAQFAPYREKVYRVIQQMCLIHPAHRMDCVEALQVLHPDSGILRAYGGRWLAAMADRRAQRA